MINLFVYFISFSIGFLLIRLILGEKANISFFLHCALALGLGLASSAALTFFFLLIYGQFNQAGLIAINLALLLFLAALNFFFVLKNSYAESLEKIKHEAVLRITMIALWIIAAVMIAILSQQFPFGGWDAWGLYNLKAKFLVFAGNHWTDVARLHSHTQPSYPLLLPLINTWIFSVFQKDLIQVASMTGVVFCLSCGFLLYAGLATFIKRSVAFLASLLLLTTPSYIFWSTTQYADVLLAYYLLASVILLILLVRMQEQRIALLAGLFWGIMPFAKNEGIVLMLLFIIITFGFLLISKSFRPSKPLRLIRSLLFGVALSASPTIIFKIFLAPVTKEVLFNPFVYKLKYCNIGGFLTTIHFFANTMLSLGWTFIWVLIALTAVLSYKKWFFVKELRMLTMIFFGFGLSLLYVYLMTAHFDLTWRLECTAIRIVLYLLPSILFLGIYALWVKIPKD